MTAPTEQAAPPSPWNVANALTVVRVLLVPVFCWLVFRHGGHETLSRLLATGAFVVAIGTDKVDGEIARRHNLVTDFGKVTDPIADKALTGAAFLSLSILGDLSWWFTVVILVRELGVTVLRFWVIRHGVIAASRGGKVKTVLQAIALGLYLLPFGGVIHVLAVVTMWLAAVVTVVTGLDYIAQAVRLHRSPRRGSDSSPSTQPSTQPPNRPPTAPPSAG